MSQPNPMPKQTPKRQDIIAELKRAALASSALYFSLQAVRLALEAAELSPNQMRVIDDFAWLLSYLVWEQLSLLAPEELPEPFTPQTHDYHMALYGIAHYLKAHFSYLPDTDSFNDVDEPSLL